MKLKFGAGLISENFKTKRSQLILIIVIIILGSSLFLLFKSKKDLFISEKNENEVDFQSFPKIQQDKPWGFRDVLKIGYLTDLHCYARQLGGVGSWNLNWRCSETLNNFIQDMNNVFMPDFAIEGGDFVDGVDDRGIETFGQANKLFNQLNTPQYHVMGNHEAREMTVDKWLNLVNYEKNYYYFDVDNFRIIVLDGNYASDDGQIVHTSPREDEFRGRINPEQWEWLENLLKKSNNYNKLVFIHQPPISSTTVKDPGSLFIQEEKLRRLFSEYKVRAVFSGHIEELCSLEYDGVDYYVLQGVHKDNIRLPLKDRFKDGEVFYEITVNNEKENGIEIKMFYKEYRKEDYKTIIVNDATAICNKETILREVGEE